SGSLSGTNTGDQTLDWVRIDRQVLLSNAASITFSSIPGTYTNLVVRVVGRTTEAAISTAVTLQVNGDTGSNYDNPQLLAVQTTATAGNTFGATTMQLGELPGASSSSANQSGYLNYTVPFYSQTTFFKMVQSLNGVTRGTSAAGIFLNVRTGN